MSQIQTGAVFDVLGKGCYACKTKPKRGELMIIYKEKIRNDVDNGESSNYERNQQM